MTPLQFKRRILKLFKNQAAAARAFGVVPSAVANWTAGTRSVPLTIIKLIEALETLKGRSVQ